MTTAIKTLELAVNLGIGWSVILFVECVVIFWTCVIFSL